MSGQHRAIQQTNKTRAGVAGALTAGALLLAPIGAALAMPGIAHAAPPGGGPGNPGGPDSGDPGTAAPDVHKNIIRLPGLKIEIKNTRGDHKPPTIKFVPAPCPTRR